MKFAEQPTWTANTGFLGCDTETTGSQLQSGCKPFMVAFGSPEGQFRCFEWDVDPKTRMPIIPVAEHQKVQEIILKYRLIMHNAQFDMRALEVIKLKLPSWDRVDDTLNLAHVHSSGSTHKLKPLALLLAKMETDDEDDLHKATVEARRYAKSEGWRYAKEGDAHFPGLKKTSGKEENNFIRMDMWLPRAVARHKMLPPEHPYWHLCRNYCLRDVERTLVVFLMLRDLVKERGLSEQYFMRQAQLEPTYEMSSYGVTINLKALDETSNTYKQKRGELQNKAFNLVNRQIDNLNSNPQLQMAMFGLLNCKTTKKTKTGWSTDKDSIDEMLLEHDERSKEHHFVKALKHYRSVDTALKYLTSYRGFGLKIPNIAEFLRMYPNFLITGTATTRYSSHDPNQQNVSKKEDFNLRSVFGPIPGRVWYSLDYNNIEMRIFADRSRDPALMAAFARGESVHMVFAEILFPKEVAECKRLGIEFKDKYESTLYQWTKNGNFSLIYGAGEKKADKTYHRPGAYNLIRSRMEKVDEFMSLKHQEARRTGRVVLINGYELDVDSSEPHKAVNYFTQGSAGIAMIYAIIRVHKYLKSLGPEYRIVMTVHDSLLLDFPDRPDNLPIVLEVKRLMESSGEDLKLSLPTDLKSTRTTWDKEERIKIAL